MSDSTSCVRAMVSETEWEQRVQLAACYRLMTLFDWDDFIFTHISARVPGPEHYFLINPYSLLFDAITASSLVKVDLEGKKQMDSLYKINPTGFTIHSALHTVREDVSASCMCTCINDVTVSAQAGGVLPLSQHSIFLLSSLATLITRGVRLEAAIHIN